jgi:hypothetical protein
MKAVRLISVIAQVALMVISAKSDSSHGMRNELEASDQ